MNSIFEEIFKYLGSDSMDAIERIIGIVLLPFFYLLIRIWTNVRNKPFLDFSLKNNFYLSDKGYIPLRYSFEMPLRNDQNELLFKLERSDKTVEQLLLNKRIFRSYKWNSHHKNILLLGQVGTGKSKTLVSIYKKCYHPVRWTPKFKQKPHCILLSMARWESNYAWKLDSVLKSFYNTPDRASMNCVLLLDGFDEFITINGLKNPINVLNDIYRYFNNFKAVVISSRLTNILFESIQNKELSGIIKPVYLLPLNKNEVVKSVNNKFNWGSRLLSIPSKKTKKVLKKLKEKDDFLLSKIAKRPLLLAFLNDIVQAKLKIRRQDLQKVVGSKKFKPITSICDEVFFSKKSFIKKLYQEINDQPNDVLRWKLQSATGELVKKAQAIDQLSSFADIYQKISIAQHQRELDKLGLSHKETIQFLSNVDEFIGIIAYALHSQKSYSIKKDDLDQAWENYFELKKIDDLSKKINIRERSFFKALSHSDLGFIHKSFQEFFHAKYLIFYGEDEFLESAIFTLDENDPVYQHINDLAKVYLQLDHEETKIFKPEFQEIAEVQFDTASKVSHQFQFESKIGDSNKYLRKKIVLPRQKDFVTAVQFFYWFKHIRNPHIRFSDIFPNVDINKFIDQKFDFKVYHSPENDTKWQIYDDNEFSDFNSIIFCSYEWRLSRNAFKLLEAFRDFSILWNPDSKGRLPIHYASYRFVDYDENENNINQGCTEKTNNFLYFILEKIEDPIRMLKTRDNKGWTPLHFSEQFTSLRKMLDYIPEDEKSIFYSSKKKGPTLLHRIMESYSFSIDEKIQLIQILAIRDNQLLVSKHNPGRVNSAREVELNPLQLYYLIFAWYDEQNLKGHKRIIETYLKSYNGPTADIVNGELSLLPKSLVDDWINGTDFKYKEYFPILLSNYKGSINDIFYAHAGIGSILTNVLFMKGENKVIELLNLWEGHKEEIILYKGGGINPNSLICKAVSSCSFKFVEKLFGYMNNKSELLFNQKDYEGYNLLQAAILQRYSRYVGGDRKQKQKQKQIRKEHLATVKMLLGVGFTFEGKTKVEKEVLSYVEEREDGEMKAILLNSKSE